MALEDLERYCRAGGPVRAAHECAKLRLASQTVGPPARRSGRAAKKRWFAGQFRALQTACFSGIGPEQPVRPQPPHRYSTHACTRSEPGRGYTRSHTFGEQALTYEVYSSEWYRDAI